MNVTINKTDSLNATITVNLTAADYAPNYQKKIKELSKSINIPGFRIGNAPKSMIEKMYGNNVLLEEVNKAASNALFGFIEENKIHVLGEPSLNKDSTISELNLSADYSFSFDIGLAPEFELNVSAADTFTKYVVDITDQMINQEIERICKRFGAMEDAEIVAENDVVYLNFTELNDGNILEGGVQATSVPVAINTLQNQDIKNSLLGSAKGKQLVLNVFALFNNNESEISHALGVQKAGVADLGPDFNCTITDIKSSKNAEVNQELFDKVYGKDAVTTEEDFKNKIKEELLGYFNGQAMHLVEHELFDKLVEKHQIQLPDAFLKRWLLNSHSDKFTQETIDEKYIPEANYLRNHLFEEKILAAANVKITEEEIKEAAYGYTRNMFGMYGGGQGLSDDLLNSIVEPQLKKDDFRSRMINLAVRKRVNEYIYNTVTLEEKLVSEQDFMQIVQAHNHAHHQNQNHSELEEESAE